MLGHKPQGVMLPKSQTALDEEGPPMTVRFVAPMTPLQVMYFDADGQGHQTVWFLGPGGHIYEPPNSEQWASSLGSVHSSLREQAHQLMQAQGGGGLRIPQEGAPVGDTSGDSLDVFGGGSEEQDGAAPSP